MNTTKILLEFNPKEKNILPAIKKICETFGYIGKKDAAFTAEYFSVPLSQIYEVASFYDHTKTEKPAKIVIQVCDSANCMMGGAFDIVREIENTLRIKEGDKSNSKIRLEAVGCLGRCGEGPIIVVNGKVYEKVSRDSAHEILGEWI